MTFSSQAEAWLDTAARVELVKTGAVDVHHKDPAVIGSESTSEDDHPAVRR